MNVASRTINAVSICTGIGGLDRGFRRALPNVRVVLYVEREVSAAGILAARMQDGLLESAPIWSSLDTLCGPECSDYLREATGGRGIDMLFGGIPCQPHSIAGKKLGADDERDCWPATLAALAYYRPGIFFLENVPGILGDVSARVVPDLRRLGYDVPRPVLLEAAAVGASQRRERIFLLAYLPGGRTQGAGIERVCQGEEVFRSVRGCRDVQLASLRSERLQGECGGRPAERPNGRSGGIMDDSAGELVNAARDGNTRQDREAGSGRGVRCESDELVIPSGEQGERRGDSGNLGSASGRVEGEEDQRQRRGDASADHGPAVLGTASHGSMVRGAGRLPGRPQPFPPGPGFGLDRVVADVLKALEAGDEDGCNRFLAELAEWAKWQRILEVRPDLAPATAQPGVRLLADGVPGGVGISRADQLRALGNGVVESQAAAALTILLHRLLAIESSRECGGAEAGQGT